MKVTESELFEQLGRTTAENAVLRKRVAELEARVAELIEPEVSS